MNSSNIWRAEVLPGGIIGNERRRVAKFIRDDRGNVTVEWHVAPPSGYERPVLRIIQEDLGELSSESDGSRTIAGGRADLTGQSVANVDPRPLVKRKR